MTKLEKLKAAHDAAWEAYDAAYDAAWEAYDAAYDAAVAARGAYKAELKKTHEEN